MPVNMLTMQHSKVSSCCAVNLIVSSARHCSRLLSALNS